MEGPNKKADIDKILSLKVEKFYIYDKGVFAYYEVAKSALPLIFAAWKKDEILIDKRVQSFVDDYLFSRIPLKDLPKESLSILPLDGRILKPHQFDFATYSYNKRNILILDETGSGKLTSLLVRAANIGFTRILALTVKGNFDDWGRDCRAVLGINPTIYEGTPKERAKINLKDAKIVLTNYEQAKNLKALLEPDFFDGIIMDEAHNGSNPEAKIYKQLESILKLNKERRFTMGSTATPVDGKKLVPLWGLINLVDPILAGKKEDFLNEYQQPTRWQNVKARNGHIYKQAIDWKIKNMSGLQRKLSAVAHRADTSAEFKFKDTSEVIPLEMTAKQRSVYESILEEYEQELDDGTFFKDNPLAKCARLFRVTEFYRQDEKTFYSTKHDWSVEYFTSLKKTGERGILWSAYLDPLETIWEKFKDCAVIYTGSRSTKYKKLAKIAFTGAKDKEEERYFYENCESVKDFPFREPKSAQFLFGIAARRASEGQNYAIADRQVVSSVNLSGRVTKQTIGRIKRTNSEHDEIFTKFLAVKDSIDVRYINLILDKIRITSDLLDGRDSEMAVKARDIVQLFRAKTR